MSTNSGLSDDSFSEGVLHTLVDAIKVALETTNDKIEQARYRFVLHILLRRIKCLK